ncbi:hypothetical protein DYH09_06000 [bacterium CPR1]|nr:hypothetical protein [bacterium CPR1]
MALRHLSMLLDLMEQAFKIQMTRMQLGQLSQLPVSVEQEPAAVFILGFPAQLAYRARGKVQ